ncbi:MAG: hypothetical protein A3G33_08580 [Omnitrophica bacterium RIFCSPLOWO2_12_FULL_44_17]|uniref:DUF547 domain-containing protein n=1 Tax=Candidatus Danuiimicrobium aquiferis TaxID=1801832 RepID=A0A1G1KWF2_9BACT|nr:MAG: hypothetical protein A3B72_03800 [Omnitrophica bacterium RIFCSPHIGHO2_02_FULL_45_28]OGW90291.1 MAG: hypothetical protein A3E74_01215 [Omnitrophica bacterium RIFCSPHIGHO2_12_FULL_44_12]OGW97220.1 MAG: hypothetical protein A3G33_08580 [Omnitrophica bacterium RIFCSPLOWO2_12_FULL_44_17]OGX02276.1 MAG: hypothetical protein A3J12_08370 [Omnitrophica bacterium RIFCSPLOWO2_02_FULL_44_11]
MRFNRLACYLAIILFWFFVLPIAYAEDVVTYESLDRIFNRDIHEGLIDYREIKQTGLSDLDSYFGLVTQLSTERLNSFSREDQIAFWINTYNAGVIREILKKYPLSKVADNPEIFLSEAIQLADQNLSLAKIQNGFLRERFRDERILTALVSGRKDSPKLSNLVYRGTTIEDQLNEAARLFAEDITKNRIIPGKKKIFLSPLLRKYQNDFIVKFGVLQESKGVSESEAAVLGFLIYHVKDSAMRLFLDSGSYKVKYLPEDSHLNEYRL